MKCVKGKNPCKYRSADELMFRDETKDTAVRAQKQWRTRTQIESSDSDSSSESDASTKVSSPLPNTSSDESERSFNDGLDVEVDAIPHAALVEPLIHQARKRFIYDFVIQGDPKQFRASYYEYVPGMLAESSPDSAVALAIDAISLANFSKRRSSQGTKDIAMAVYGKAMNAANAAIAHPKL